MLWPIKPADGCYSITDGVVGNCVPRRRNAAISQPIATECCHYDGPTGSVGVSSVYTGTVGGPVEVRSALLPQC